jgi:hypothetical protein
MKRLDNGLDVTVLKDQSSSLARSPDGNIHMALAKSSARITWLGNTSRNAG